ncbi:MAG: YciI family protein [Salibacteraceae bacterium]
MNRIFTLFFTVATLAFLSPSCQEPIPSETNNTKGAERDNIPVKDSLTSTSEMERNSSMKYDAELAKQLDADAYGMKPYVMAWLKKGPNRSTDTEEAARLQRAHLDNINQLAESGKLVLAGPFMDDGEVRGIYIFNVATIEEARALTATDPAIQTGSLIMELHPWYGSASLQLINEWHAKISKENI